jgi:alanyl-tRNA synthetase
LTSARVPCKSIERYPVVARWRSDVDYVAAGIYCFQPYCVTGELDPPANPLICPQFCVRFNDLDNIGLTGRHYSGFIMLGIQVFNYPNKHVFFKDECVEFNYRWLTEELKIDPEEITFIEDVWAGGGNLGPSIEYFVNGLELGNMVFMQYKTFHDGSREELPIKIIDTGIGLERVAWLINGSPTSYVDTFKNALEFITNKLGVSIDNQIWENFGPLSSLLNIDEVDNIDKTWEFISKEINVDVQAVKSAIAPVKDLYIVLDHTRTVFMIIYDGSLPSNVGGGSNVRNILRRVFAILKKNNWLEKLGVEGICEIFDYHCKDLEGIYGEFKKHPNIKEIIALEFEKWKSTDKEQKDKLEKLMKKKGGLTIDDWILGMQSWGIPADRISELTGLSIPGNLYYIISQNAERIVQATEPILYDTTHLNETDSIYFKDPHQSEFEAKIIEVFVNLEKGKYMGVNNIVILDQSAFYPNSGGQANDIGLLTLDGEEYQVVNVEKVGKCVLHILHRELPGAKSNIGKSVKCKIDMRRRLQLMGHHTGTHIVFAAARKVLGPHIWQNGAKKTEEVAHLDITHYKGLTYEEEVAIEREANRIIMSGLNISKYFMDKSEAEKNFGFSLYQGGVVPGNNLRIVQIENTDVEACCGTHHDNTSEVGLVKMVKSQRISDGIVRLYYTAVRIFNII